MSPKDDARLRASCNQKHVRLQEARIRLMSSKDDVTAIGSSVGYVACLLASDTGKWKPATVLSTTRFPEAASPNSSPNCAPQGLQKLLCAPLYSVENMCAPAFTIRLLSEDFRPSLRDGFKANRATIDIGRVPIARHQSTSELRPGSSRAERLWRLEQEEIARLVAALKTNWFDEAAEKARY